MPGEYGDHSAGEYGPDAPDFADTANLKNGIITSTVSNGASALAWIARWLSAVALPTDGATAFAAQWQNNASVIRHLYRIWFSSSRPFFSWYAADETEIARLDTGAGTGPSFSSLFGWLNLNTTGGPIQLQPSTSVVRLGQADVPTKIAIGIPMTNKTGGSLVVGDVVKIDPTTTDRSVIAVTASGRKPVVVVDVGDQAGANNTEVYVGGGGRFGTVKVDTVAVARTDTLIGSATATRATSNGVTNTDPSLILGWALTTKSGGSTGTVEALLLG